MFSGNLIYIKPVYETIVFQLASRHFHEKLIHDLFYDIHILANILFKYWIFRKKNTLHYLKRQCTLFSVLAVFPTFGLNLRKKKIF